MDYSYQHRYPEYPEVPRPILAAAWESNNYDAVDVLLDMEPDTRVLWTDDAESKNPPKPVFFQVLRLYCKDKVSQLPISAY
jgi:hypothetical protein